MTSYFYYPCGSELLSLGNNFRELCCEDRKTKCYSSNICTHVFSGTRSSHLVMQHQFSLFGGLFWITAAFRPGDSTMTICVKGVLLSGIDRCTRMHQLSCRNLYFMRLFSSVSPICLRINGTTTNLICSAHTTLYPLKYSVQRKLGLYTKSFSSAGSKVLSSPTLAVPRYQIGSCDPAVRRNETLLQGRAMVPGKNNNGEHFLWHLKQKSIQMFYMHAVFIEWQKCNHSPNRSIYCLCHQEAARTLDGVPTVGVPCC